MLKSGRPVNKNSDLLVKFIKGCKGLLFVANGDIVFIGAPAKEGKVLIYLTNIDKLRIRTTGTLEINCVRREGKLSPTGIEIPHIASWETKSSTEHELIFFRKSDGRTISFYDTEGYIKYSSDNPGFFQIKEIVQVKPKSPT